MEQNFECVRALIKELETSQVVSPSGKPSPVHLNRLYSSEGLKEFSAPEVDTAALYLVDKGLIRLREGQKFPQTGPRAFVIAGITGSGYDYLAAVKDDTMWKKIKETLGKIGLASVPNVISVAAKLLVGL